MKQRIQQWTVSTSDLHSPETASGSCCKSPSVWIFIIHQLKTSTPHMNRGVVKEAKGQEEREKEREKEGKGERDLNN